MIALIIGVLIYFVIDMIINMWGWKHHPFFSAVFCIFELQCVVILSYLFIPSYATGAAYVMAYVLLGLLWGAIYFFFIGPLRNKLLEEIS